MTARDALYGRRGGGWVDGGDDGLSLAEALDAIRAANGGMLRIVTPGCDNEPGDAQLDLFGEP